MTLPRSSAFRSRQNPQAPTVDTQGFLEHDICSGAFVLDPVLSLGNMSPDHYSPYRKDSLMASEHLQGSHDKITWDRKHRVNGFVVDQPLVQLPSDLFQIGNGPFLEQDMSLSHAPPSWNYEQTADTFTPISFGPHSPQQSHYDGTQVVAKHAGWLVSAPIPQVQTPTSPTSQKDWRVQTPQDVTGRSFPRHMLPGSTSPTTCEFPRRDGIRKKNARVDIPAERSLVTIDKLIAQSTDDDETKELKAQKRLLRNREAALNSRQRKKRHTEDLEVREKKYVNQITALENRVSDLQLQASTSKAGEHFYHQRFQEATRLIDTLQFEKEDQSLRHTKETSILNARIQQLSEQLEANAAPAMSTGPSSAGLTDFTSDMHALATNNQQWDTSLLFQNLDELPEELSASFATCDETVTQLILNLCKADSSKRGSGEVYTHTLMWEQIPTDVAGYLKKLISGSHSTTHEFSPKLRATIKGGHTTRFLAETGTTRCSTFGYKVEA